MPYIHILTDMLCINVSSLLALTFVAFFVQCITVMYAGALCRTVLNGLYSTTCLIARVMLKRIIFNTLIRQRRFILKIKVNLIIRADSVVRPRE